MQIDLLGVFRFIFCIAIALHVFFDRGFLATTPSLYALVGLLLIAAVSKKFQTALMAVIMVLYYLVLSKALSENTAQGLFGTWNHAIVFWVFLCLALRPLWGERKTIFAIKFLLVMAYFAAGWSKLGHDPSWANGYTLQHILLGRMVHTGSEPLWPLLTDLRLAIAASYLVIAMEILSPLALLHRYTEYLFVLATLIFHWACWHFMGIYWMKYFGWVYLIFILDWVGPRLHRQNPVAAFLSENKYFFHRKSRGALKPPSCE